jgi:aminopeptidase N
MNKPSSVDATLAGPAFSVTAENGDAELYQRFAAALNATKSSDAYYHYLYALADFRQSQSVYSTLALIDEGKVRQQDYPRFFAALLGNPASRDAAWKYLKDHWNDLSQKVTSFGGAGAVSALGNACSVEMSNDVRQFFEQHPAPGAQRAVQQSLNRINNCVDFKQAQEKNLQARLAREQ